MDARSAHPARLAGSSRRLVDVAEVRTAEAPLAVIMQRRPITVTISRPVLDGSLRDDGEELRLAR